MDRIRGHVLLQVKCEVNIQTAEDASDGSYQTVFVVKHWMWHSESFTATLGGSDPKTRITIEV